MSFVPNENQQISLFDMLAFLSDRKQKMLKNSWAQTFSDQIFTRINEYIFAPLYSDSLNSRPNAPINVLVGAMILKEFFHQNDTELTESCEFDFRFQYALHTTSFEVQPISERSLSRFRSRLYAYELTTGEDLLHKCFIELSDGLREYMEINPDVKRMDSMMIESNIKKMGRLELLYTCLSNLVKTLMRSGAKKLVKGLEFYADPNSCNKLVYHDKDTPLMERIQKVIDDATKLLPKCQEDFSDTRDYQLLERAITEQTKKYDSGRNIPKAKDEGMTSGTLQNPADPDATYRMKGKGSHRGYAANITETVDEGGSIITDYQYDLNTRSDVNFWDEVVKGMEPSDKRTTIIADGAYAADELQAEAAAKNIAIITTGLRGRKPRKILTKFTLSKDGKSIEKCPKGYTPLSSSYIEQTNLIRASFPKHCCEKCPHRSKCNVAIKPRTALMFFSIGSLIHTKEHLWRKKHADTMRIIGNVRNGVETIPSLLRRKYHVDKMPFRGKLRTKTGFAFKVFAVNLTKTHLFNLGLLRCRPLEPKTS